MLHYIIFYYIIYSYILIVFIKIVDSLNHLATTKLEEVHGDVPLKFIRLIQLMRFGSLDDFEGIWAQFKNRPNFRYIPVKRKQSRIVICELFLNYESSKEMDPRSRSFGWLLRCIKIHQEDILSR